MISKSKLNSADITLVHAVESHHPETGVYTNTANIDNCHLEYSSGIHSRRMSRISRILILRYKLREVTIFYVCCFELQRIVHISTTRCPVEFGFGSKRSIVNERVTYI